MDSAAPSFRSEQTERFLAAAPSTLIPNHPFPMLSGKPPQKTESKPLKAKVRKVAHACNPSTLGGRGVRDRTLVCRAVKSPLHLRSPCQSAPPCRRNSARPTGKIILRETADSENEISPYPFAGYGDISFSAPPAHRQEYQGSAAIVSKASLQTAFFLYTSTLPAGT